MPLCGMDQKMHRIISLHFNDLHVASSSLFNLVNLIHHVTSCLTFASQTIVVCYAVPAPNLEHVMGSEQ